MKAKDILEVAGGAAIWLVIASIGVWLFSWCLYFAKQVLPFPPE